VTPFVDNTSRNAPFGHRSQPEFIMRTKIVVVAVVRDENGKYLVTHNPRWDGYSFPMNAVESRNDVSGREAIRALEEDLGCTLPDARAEELEFLVNAGISETAEELTSYDFHLFEVQTAWLSHSDSLQGLNSDPLFLSKDEIVERQDITWGTREITRDFTTFSDVVVAVLTRRGPAGTEVLLVWSSYWNGYFLPSQRCGSDATHATVLRKTLRDDLGYTGEFRESLLAEDSATGMSARFGPEHNYMLHLYQVELLGASQDPWFSKNSWSDSSEQPLAGVYGRLGNLERRMKSNGKRFLWVKLDQLRGLAIAIPPKAERIIEVVNKRLPDLQLPKNLKSCTCAVGIVRLSTPEGFKFLARWNPDISLVTYIGGEFVAGESAYASLGRYLQQQLSVPEKFLQSDPSDTGVFYDYIRVAESDGVLTHYKLTLFHVVLSAEAIAQSKTLGSDLRWLSVRELRQGMLDNGPRIDPLFTELLIDAELIPPAENRKPKYL
jgi:hypothetical protein